MLRSFFAAITATLLIVLVLTTNQLSGQDPTVEQRDDPVTDRDNEPFDDDEDESSDPFNDDHDMDEDDHGFGDEQEEEFSDEPFSEDQMQIAAWIGVETGPLDPAVAAHISLPEGQGLMIYEVIEEGPAAASGLQEFDILLSVNGESLSEFGDLRRQVEGAKGKSLSLEILRKGAKQSLTLAVGQRPWIPDVFMPGSIDIPDDVEVTISKRGRQPVTVTVKQGDQTWQASSEEELEQLPERVVMWLFETMNDFMPFDEEEEWNDEGDFGFGEQEEEDHFGPGRDRFHREMEFEDRDERLDHLEHRLDRVLERLESRN